MVDGPGSLLGVVSSCNKLASDFLNARSNVKNLRPGQGQSIGDVTYYYLWLHRFEMKDYSIRSSPH